MRSPPRPVTVAAGAALVIAGCGSSTGTRRAPSRAQPPVPAALEVTSPAFAAGGTLPRRFTCDGASAEPPLRVAHVPARAASLAVSVQDLDVPGGFIHWVAFDIPAATRAPSPAPGGAHQARNDFGGTGYGAPCPPRGAAAHRYVFTVYALSQRVALPNGAPARTVIANLRGATIADGQIFARYSRASG